MPAIIELCNDTMESEIKTESFVLRFDAISKNEAFARTTAAAFAARLDPTIEEISDIRTVVSEAVTNAIIHGYPDGNGVIEMTCSVKGNELTITVKDEGVGIPDIKKAMEPLYTTRPEWERSGMGFAFMEAFTDELTVKSEVGSGTYVSMKKRIGGI